MNEKVDQEYICEVIATDDAGTIVEHLQGYRLRILEAHPENPTAAELAHPAQRDHTAIQTALTTAAQQVGVVVPKVALTYAPALGTQPKKKSGALLKSLLWNKHLAKSLPPTHQSIPLISPFETNAQVNPI